jgi:hypothetical protein
MSQTLTAGDEPPQTPQHSQDKQENGVRLRAGSPAELLSIIPHLLGFVPESSLVLIGTEPRRSRVKVTLRYDLPDPPDADLAADVAAHAVGVITAQGLTATVAVGYGPEPLVGPVAGALRDAMRKAGIGLGDFLRAEAGRYWSYVCGNEACCPAAGVPYDANPDSAALTGAAAGMEIVAAGTIAPTGSQVLPDRAAVAARVAALGGNTAESMRQATRRAERHVTRLLSKIRKSGRLGAVRHLIAAEGLAAVHAMITTYRAGGTFSTDYQIAWMTVALRELRVRDDAWARMDPAHTDAHRRLWTDVTQRARPGYVAAPAALLAFVAWQSGDGALANVALDRALADDARYSMALLLRQVITAGAPPSMARLPMTPEEVAASYDDAEEDAAREDDDEEGNSEEDSREEDNSEEDSREDAWDDAAFVREPDPAAHDPVPDSEP